MKKLWLGILLPLGLNLTALAQSFLPADVGAAVAGFQDDFDAPDLSANWQVHGADVYSPVGGVLRVSTATGDPNHLLYEASGYNNSVQEVLARIRVLSFGNGDPSRGGIATVVDAATSQGINLHFRDEPTAGQRHMEFLDDLRAWGTEYAFNWQNNTWYWLRLRHEPNAASQGGVNDVVMKIWLGDGSQAEPASWQATYDYIPGRTARSGFAGIVASSTGGVGEFEIDYILIKASGLPNIVVAPNSFVQTPAAITNQPQSQTVVEGNSVTFSVGAAGHPRPTYQWYRDNVFLDGATNSSYTIQAVALSDDDAVFKVVVENVVSNTTYTITSSNAVLSVIGDTLPPSLRLAQAIGLTQVQVTFSERVTFLTATNMAHYQITNSGGTVAIASGNLDASQTNVTLNVGTLTEGATYTLIVNGIGDPAGNIIPSNSRTNFTALSFAPAAIGNPQPAGSAVPAPGGIDVTAGGLDIGGTADQFQFNYQSRTDDFDVKVRIRSVSLADAWSEAGLVAREDLTPGGRFAGAFATPSVSGCYFQQRGTAGGAATMSGAFPVNYPNTWLRLRRVGSQFTGYAGFDGENWTQLGTAAIPMPATISLGFAVSSHNTNQTTTAGFRDFANVLSAGTLSGPLPVEPLGQSSRRTSLVISEIMYNPLDRPDGRNLEFVELFNSLATPQDISGWRLDGDADFTFPQGTIIAGGGFLVVAQSPADLESVYGISGVLGPFSSTNSLPNTSGSVQLRNRIGAVFLDAFYDTAAPWPAAADGAGHSLVLARPSYGEGDARAWAPSDLVGGSPGSLDPVTVDPLRNVLINEFLANTDPPDLDFIELYNHSNEQVEISGCTLSDSRNTNKFIIGPNTILPPRGFISYTEEQLGFALSSGGEGIYFRSPSGTRVLDSLRFGAQATGISSGRSADGAPGFVELTARTAGTNNSIALVRPIVINEIMYNPISRNSDDEFIEFYNNGANSINLAGWRLTGGIGFLFPSNTIVPAGGYLVVARDVERLRSRYVNLNSANTVGNYSGSLANGGERIALAMPAVPFPTNGTPINTNTDYVVVDEVTYVDGGRWGRWSDGGGSSLELKDPRSDNRLAANWADSDETAKAPWTVVSVRGVLDNGTSAADQLQVLLQGAGECLIDDVEVVTAAGANLIANSTFEANATGWTAEGTQSQSAHEPSEGYNSARSYHVHAVDRGDNQINRIRTPLTAAQTANTTNTIRAKVRWLRGHPEILFRLRGNWLEAAVTMDLPTNLGTPGARNSRAVTNAPPAIYDVVHHPAVPAANEPVVVTARVYDPDGLGLVQLRYRLDPSATLLSVVMRDDGTGGDSVAGDGLFAATLPGRPTGTLAAFHVQATDQFSPQATGTFPSDAPVHECLVRFGEFVPSGNFPSYRIWMTQASFNAWDAHHNLDNTLNDITFVLGNHRVFYNAASTYAGSPYISGSFNTPSGNRCGYTMDFPNDDPILGDNRMNIDWPGGHGNENTAIQEQMAYWLAEQMDIAYSHRYFIRLTVNGVTDHQRTSGAGVFEAVLQPAGEFLEQWSPGDSEGDFFRIDRAFEFSDAPGLIADPEPQLRVYTTRDVTTGGTKKKIEKYRWYWLKRSFESANDYTNLLVVADTLNLPPATPAAPANPELYTELNEALIDTEQWMGIFAAEHIINNFDSWGHDIGKNMYMYKPQQGRWQLYMFDLDWLMLVSPSGPGGYTASTGPLFSSDDPTVTRMYNHPPFRRAYFRACEKAVNRAFVAAKYEAVMDAKYRSLVANGITLCDGQTLAAPTLVKNWFRDRRIYLQTQLASVASAAFAVSGTNFITTNNNLVVVSGTAPIGVTAISINGVAWPVNWTAVNTWQARISLDPGTNRLEFTAENYEQQRVGSTNVLTAVFNGSLEDPADSVVINEIMHQPALPDAEYVELFNSSGSTTFPLSNWRLNGLDYTFPGGTVLPPNGVLLLVKDRSAFHTLFGSEVRVFDQFNGNLQASGETLTLLRPHGQDEVVVDRVRYESVAPWPGVTNGASLQLLDPHQDNARVSNWSDGSGWRRATYTGTNQGNANPSLQGTNFVLFMDRAGDVYIDDIMLVEGSVAEAGPNLLANGGFESALTGPWIVSPNMSNSVISTQSAHSGNASLHVVARAAGGVPATSISQVFAGRSTNFVATLSFWYLPSTNGNALVVRTTPGSTFLSRTTVLPVSHSAGMPNSVATPVPPYPTLWLNEIQPENISGIIDSGGQREPWVEIYNSGTTAVSLDGLFLSQDYDNRTQWPFPPGISVAPGEFKLVFLDAQPGQSSPSALHANFEPLAGTGSVVLSQQTVSEVRIVDYLNYTGVRSDSSYGSYPDGQPFFRQEMYYATARASNNAAAPPAVLFINEWMAQNSGTLADPADGHFEDWFEIYNPGSTAVDLRGYFVTDNPGVPSQYYEIPAAYIVPPGGYLLVWADDEANQNSPSRADLHAAFRLSQGGEAIALYAPDQTLVDTVTFGVQTADISEGRYPNGLGSQMFFWPATPRQANVESANRPPSLDAIANRAVYLGQSISFVATASDSDQPPQTLSFNLEAAPPNATIDAGSGLFAWTPSSSQVPSTNSITVQVMDDGFPAQIASRTFTVRALLPPQAGIAQVGAQVQVTFPTIAGKTYRITYTSDLSAGQWFLFGAPMTASGSSLGVMDNLGPDSQRFYRIEALD